jgi:hypothetical protein
MDDNDYIGELDKDIFELPNGNGFCRIYLNKTTTVQKITGLEMD